jgi:hypothetical protein
MTSSREISRRKNYNRKEVLLKSFRQPATIDRSTVYGVERMVGSRLDPGPNRVDKRPGEKDQQNVLSRPAVRPV